MFSLDGIFNQFLCALGIEPIMFMGSNTWFRTIIISTDVWKNFGYGAIVYLAALTSIDPNLYEAADIDGATRFKQLMNITLPALVPTIILMTTLSLGNILNAGFDQIFNMYNPLVYETADIIDTYVYRMGLVEMQYSLSTAVGFLKSIVSFLLITISYYMANKFAGYKIF
jgi:putative aldouronate transport system permease protein